MKYPEGSVEALYFELPKDWKEKIKLIFKDGGDVISAHLAIGVQASSHKKLMGIEEYYEEFENGIALSEAYWIRWARENLEPVDGEEEINGEMYRTKTYGKPDTKLFNLMMDRLFRWKKKIDDDNTNKNEGEKIKLEAQKITGKYLRKVK